MSTSLAEVDLRVGDGGRPTQNIEDIAIIGNPLHNSERELLTRYRDSPTDFLSYEARHSCGSYLLVDTREALRVLTSPSYCGGYIATLPDGYAVTTALSTALSYYDLDELSIDSFRLFQYISRGRYCRLPFRTMFDGVVRLPPGIDLQFDQAGSGFQRRSYLGASSPPESFADALDEISCALSGEDVVLALSGGIDSAALACAFLENDVSFRAVTFDIGIAYRRSHDIARELGIEHEILETPVPADAGRRDRLEDAMSQDLMMCNNERLGFLGVDESSDEIGISGRNMDNMAAMKMEDMYPSRSLVQALKEPKPAIGDIFQSYVSNLQYTDTYLGNPVFRKAYLEILQGLTRGLSTVSEAIFDSRLGPNPLHADKYRVDVDANPESMFRGVLSTWHPNIIQNPIEERALDGEGDGVEDSSLDEEVRDFEEIDPLGVQNSSKALKHLLYFSFSQNAQKTPTQFLPTQFQSETPLSYAPSLSYFFNKTHSINSITNPKQEPYKYFESVTGKPYEDIVTAEDKPYSLSGESTLLSANREVFTKGNSVVHSLVDSQFETALEKLYEDYKERIEATDYTVRGELRQLQRVLNLELVLHNSIQPR